MCVTRAEHCVSEFDALIVGAGFAGLYMLHRLRGLGFRARVIEAADGVGGTWYWNRYPGARCDIESTQYSYQFSPELEQEWCWSERYAGQAEILSYANHVADRFDLRRDIDFGRRVVTARFDDAARQWMLDTDDGKRYRGRICIMATGCLSVPVRPSIEGLDAFSGLVVHTGEWPHAPLSLQGKRVAVIGTGSSGIQAVPVIARTASSVTVFQRTPSYAVPARNIPLPPAVQAGIKAIYRQLRTRAKLNPTGVLFDSSPERALETSPEVRHREYERRWARGGLTFLGAFADLLTDASANETAAAFVRAKIREIVEDQSVAAQLTPHNFIGARRLCVDMGYFEAFNRPNVALVDVAAAPIERVSARGVVVADVEHAADIIVLATGFDAMTGALGQIDIRGRDGHALKEKWQSGARTLLGLAIHGFPNLFTITGPGSPSVLTNLLPSIEQHVEWIGDCLAFLRQHGLALVEASAEAEEAWTRHVADAAQNSLRAREASWYAGANVPGKPRVFLPYAGGFPRYVETCNDVARSGYQGFVLEPEHVPAAAAAK